MLIQTARIRDHGILRPKRNFRMKQLHAIERKPQVILIKNCHECVNATAAAAAACECDSFHMYTIVHGEYIQCK